MKSSILSLQNFEENVDSTIVKRGKDYYRKGSISDLEELDKGKFQALVEGTEIYTIKINMDGDIINDHICDCPYDMGPVCKHEVAVMFKLRERIHPHETKPTVNRTTKSPVAKSKQPTVREQIEHAIQSISKDTLGTFVMETALSDRKFRAALLRKVPMSSGSGENLKPIYIKQIKECINAAKGRHGFIDYYQASQSVVAADELLDVATDYLANNRYKDVIPIAQAVIETLYPDLNNVDDSDGSYGYTIGRAWELFCEAAQHIDSTSACANDVFEYCLKEVSKEKYRGWFDENTFYEVAARLVHDDQKMDRLFEVLKKPKIYDTDSGVFASRYDRTHAVKIMIDVCKRLGKHTEAQALVDENMYLSDIRESALQQAYKKRDYKRVKELATGGVLQAEKDKHRGTAHTFEIWLLTIAEKEQDVDTTQFYLKKFFFDRYEFDYYDRLKKTYSDKQWQDILPQLIEAVNQGNRPFNNALLTIYMRENRWDDFLQTIMGYCSNNKNNDYFIRDSLSFLDSYHKPLAEHYPEELISLYVNGIKQSLQQTKGRSHYQYVCRILRRMKKIGGKNDVAQIVAYCRDTWECP